MSKHFNKLRDPRLGLDDMLPFGRHQGYTVLEIIKDRPQYISWLMSNTDLKFHRSVHDELYRYLAKHVPSHMPRRNNYYFYDGGARGDMAHETLTQMQYAIDQGDWFDDVPF